MTEQVIDKKNAETSTKSLQKIMNGTSTISKVSIYDAKKAIRTLLKWLGEDPDRSGLIDTPKRVISSYAKYFNGYNQNPDIFLKDSLDEVNGYNEAIILQGIDFVSHCEHHLAPIIGTVHIAYLPNQKIIGISRLVNIVNIFAHRLQIQERLNSQIANCLYTGLDALGVVVIIEAKHHCLHLKNINSKGKESYNSTMKTRSCEGIYAKDLQKLNDIMTLFKM